MHAQRRVCLECGHAIGAGTDRLEVGHLTIDGFSRAATWKGQPVALPPMLFRFVELFASRPGREVRRETFFTLNIMPDDGELHTVDVHIHRIRKAFKAVDPEFDQLKSVWGTGYRWAR